jgi:hypothetical protein
MIRQHDVQVVAEGDALADGTFRVVLTSEGRLITAIDVPDSALGPLHLVFVVSSGAQMSSTFATGSLFGGLGRTVGHIAHDVGHAAETAGEGAFNLASSAAASLARPAFDLTRDAAAAGASLVAHVPFVPESDRAAVEAASRTIMRARLGDVNAQQFVRAVGVAAKAGLREAQRAGDALLTGTKVVAHVLDTPLALMEKVPAVGGMLQTLDPLRKMSHVADALQRGDFNALRRIIESDAKLVQGVVSYLPGIGTGVGAAIGAGIAVLDGGGAIEIALHTAYGAIPIPPGLRSVTDGVLDGVLGLLHHGPITDAALAAARNAIPSGIARDVFDTLIKLVVHHRPILHVADDLVGSYVRRYAPDLHVSAAVEIGGAASAARRVVQAAAPQRPDLAPLSRDLVPISLRLPAATAAAIPRTP